MHKRSSSPTRILVTGAAGFIGYHLAVRIAAQDNTEVFCVDNFARGNNDTHYRGLLAKPNVTGIEVDLCNRRDLDRLPDEIDFLFHMAALNGTQNFYESPFDVVRHSTLPTLMLLDRFAAQENFLRFVYASTSETYASTVTEFGWPVPTDEEVPLCIADIKNPRWSYAASKLCGEVAVVAAATQIGMPFTIIRYHNVFGPRMGDKHVVPDFVNRALQGVFSLYGHRETRAFMYIDDAVRTTWDIATHDAAQGEIINVGSEREITIHDLGNLMMRIGGFSGQLQLLDGPPGSVARRAPDIAKLRRLIGFTESVSLEEGLANTIEFYRSSSIVAETRHAENNLGSGR